MANPGWPEYQYPLMETQYLAILRAVYSEWQLAEEFPKRRKQYQELQRRDELAKGQVDAIFFRGVNPLYDLPFGAGIGTGIRNILTVSFGQEMDETAAGCDHVCPEPHFLESWGDSEPTAGNVSIRQPVIRPIGDTRQASVGDVHEAFQHIGQLTPRQLFARNPPKRAYGCKTHIGICQQHQSYVRLSAPRVPARSPLQGSWQ